MQKDTENGKPVHELGVALSGGGARGLAHAGALAAIEEAGLRPDIIAGVSAGSIAAVLYAAGRTPRQIVDIFTNRGFKDFVEFRPHHGGIFGVDPFKRFVAENIKPYKNLEELPIDVYLGVTDFDHGIPVEFHTGGIVDRVMASCAIPIVFKPVEIDGVNYVDGGVLRNHPAWIIRDKCKTLIGVNVSPLKPRPGSQGFVDVAMRTYNLMAKANQLSDMRLCDVSVETPEIASYRTFDLRSVRNLYLSGYIHTRKALRVAGLWKNDLSKPPTE